MSEPIVIVGGGHAAAQLCVALAEKQAGCRIHLVCEEPVHPYHRPPLSKAYLTESGSSLQLHREAAWYSERGITVYLGDSAREIDREARKIRLASGVELSYSKLVLATGTRPRTLPALHGQLANVATLRSVADAEFIRSRLHERVGDLVVIGGGFIGLEVAGTARRLGWKVQVLEAAPRLLPRSASPDLSSHVLHHHREMGTKVEVGTAVDEFVSDGDRLLSLNAGGARRTVDQILVGIGAQPETGIAQAAGLATDNGVLVDRAMVTSDPDILAIGDCAAFSYRGQSIRLESVHNASEQAKVAADTLMGRAAAYEPTPFFWSDQGGLRLQMTGLWRAGLSTVRRQAPAQGSFSLFHYAGPELVSAESVNAPQDHLWCRKLLEQHASPSPHRVADPQVPLSSLF